MNIISNKEHDKRKLVVKINKKSAIIFSNEKNYFYCYTNSIKVKQLTKKFKTKQFPSSFLRDHDTRWANISMHILTAVVQK